MNKNQHTFEAKNIVTGYDKKIIKTVRSVGYIVKEE